VHEDAISPDQRRALHALKPLVERGFYLAGGSGLCLRLAHRRSIDLDLFRDHEFDPEELLADLQSRGVSLSDVRSKPNTLWFELEHVQVSLMRFPYPILEPTETAADIPVASLADIAAMKVEAIASRGARKDFVDLYSICHAGLGLSDALSAFERRFASAHPDVLHRLKALTYFDDAEREPELLMLVPVSWQDVRSFFEREVRALWAAPRSEQ
jgi:hypothetical protein